MYDLGKRGVHEKHFLHEFPVSATRDDKVERGLPSVRQSIEVGAVLDEKLRYMVVTVVRSPVLYESAMARTSQKERAFNLQLASRKMMFQ